MASVQPWKEKAEPVLTVSEEFSFSASDRLGPHSEVKTPLLSHGSILSCLSLHPQEVQIAGISGKRSRRQFHQVTRVGMRTEVGQCGDWDGEAELQGLIRESKEEDLAWGRGVGESACSGNSGSCASSGWVEVVGCK